MPRPHGHHDEYEMGVRVILLGARELEQSWRRDPRIDLVRARSGFEVIGEVGRPEGRTVVIIDDQRETSERAESIVAAVRQVNPRVRVLHMERSGGPDLRLADETWDGAVRTDTSLEEALGDLLGEPRPARASSSDAPVAPSDMDPLETLPPPPTMTGPASSGGRRAVRLEPGDDLDLVRRILGGESVADAAMDLLRRRPGLKDLAFHADGVDGSVAVRYRGHAVGYLCGASEERLTELAGWLAPWLALAEQQTQLRTAAFTDPLTGAWNRRYFDRFLTGAIDEARARRRCVSLLLFDIDDFKTYNDRFGHPAGDEILSETVKLLTAVVRPTDRVCRIGGDEFAIIFHEPDGPRNPPSQHPASIFEIAHRIRDQIRQHHFPKLGRCGRGTLTISGGLATFPWDGHDAQSLIEHADRLTLESKSQGKNVICFGSGVEPAGPPASSESPT